MFTLGQASKETKVSKATLSRAIKSGRISASKNDKGGFDIDPAELFRVFPRNSETVSGNSTMKQTVTPIETPETARLEAEIQGLKAQLSMMREYVDDLKGQRDKWQEQAEQSQRILQDMRPVKRKWFSFGT